MTISNDDDLARLKAIGGIVARVLAFMGRALHEEPGQIPTWHEPRDRHVMHDGLVFTIEPFLSTGAEWVDLAPDGWTLTAPPGVLTVQYEHTVVATKRGPLVVAAAQ